VLFIGEGIVEYQKQFIMQHWNAVLTREESLALPSSCLSTSRQRVYTQEPTSLEPVPEQAMSPVF
jgi:hypothetical protein